MPNVELWISPADRSGLTGSLELWAFAVEVANEPCVLLNRDGAVVAVSPGCGDLFRVDIRAAVGKQLVGDVLRLLDFNTMSGTLPGWESDKTPPLLAIKSEGLARGLLRVSGEDGTPATVDAISVPLRDDGAVVGSLTFFAPVGR